MNNFTFWSPTKFVFGRDTESLTGDLVKQFGGKKALIVYGGGSVVRSGLLDRVKKSLDDAGVAWELSLINISAPTRLRRRVVWCSG
ncbi:MAG: iron-containing alcohol dehydrogenase, partial [Muribaculum sp.]|nr:iron-containing alcohol dehydrogenase [Muribaculum sp.]